MSSLKWVLSVPTILLLSKCHLPQFRKSNSLSLELELVKLGLKTRCDAVSAGHFNPLFCKKCKSQCLSILSLHFCNLIAMHFYTKNPLSKMKCKKCGHPNKLKSSFLLSHLAIRKFHSIMVIWNQPPLKSVCALPTFYQIYSVSRKMYIF